jgi:hypothetical protein
MLRYITQKIQLKPYSIFYIDGIGAALSCFLLYLLVAPNYEFFGMPEIITLLLAAIALLLAFFSLCCFKLKPKKQKLFLLFVIVANVLYCIITLAILIQFFNEITIWGFLYFLMELMILSVLIYVELQVYTIEGSN